MEKLYVVVRDDLSPGDMICQSAHAVADFCMRYPGRAAQWHDNSNYLIILSVPNEQLLVELIERLEGFRSIVVHEPDLDDEITAIAVEHDAWRILSSLPLACREKIMV